ncbi:MAG: hypothetical protein HKN46_04410 [Acidimicrobiia bacterium]|nr:hypothetical protein [Acidimicrobiia bacterium]
MADAELETLLARWRDAVGPEQARAEPDLRDDALGLSASGMAAEEAFLIAVTRLAPVQPAPVRLPTEGLTRMVAVALAAAAVVLAPRLFLPSEDYFEFLVRNVPFLVLPVLVFWLLAARGALRRVGPWLLAGFAALAALVNFFPFEAWSDIEFIVILHAPVVAWVLVAVAHMAGEWRSHERRMDVVRFTGEAFVYVVLMALGGGVLVGIAIGLFGALGIDVAEVVGTLVPGAAAGALIVAAWLVDRPEQVVERIAPLLSAIFTPLFGIVLGIAAVAGAVSGFGIDVDREVLILFDVLLVLVTGLLLYRVSARDASDPKGVLDLTHLATIGFALLLDVVGLAAMVGRIAEFGASPNKVVALGLNLVLLVVLGRSGWLLLGFLRDGRPFSHLDRWQTTTLPIYAAWALAVVVLVPLVFGME